MDIHNEYFIVKKYYFSRFIRITLFLSCLYSSHITANTKNETDRLFNLSLDELMSLEISTASKTPEKLSKIPANVTIITREKINTFGYTTLTEILEDVPGMFNLYQYNGASGNFGIRGLANTRVQNSSFLILVNGVSQLRSDERSNQIETINVPPEAIDRIEIIRGPSSVIYGNGAFFGVINIITNEITDHEYIVSGSAGSLQTSKFVVRTAKKMDNLKFTFTASAYDTNGPDNNFRNMTNATLVNPNLTTDGLLEHNNKYINFSGSYNNWYFDAAYNATDIEYFSLFPPAGPGSPIETGTPRNTVKQNFTLGYTLDATNWFTIDSHITYVNFNQTGLITEILAGNIGTQTISNDSYEAEVIASIKANKDLDVIYGINFQRMNNLEDLVNAPLTSTQDMVLINERPTHSIFTQIAYNINDDLKIITGFRNEKISQYMQQNITDFGTPMQVISNNIRAEKIINTHRLALIFTFDEKNVMKVMYGIANRVSDDAFDAEEIETYEINYIHKKTGFVSNISVFRNNMNNILVRESNLVTGGSDFQTGEIVITGIEASIDIEHTNALTSQLSITYQDSENVVDNSLEVAYSPRIVAHGKLYYTLRNHIFSLSARFISSMETHYNVIVGSRIGDPVSDYAVADVNYRYNNFVGNAYLNVRATNIFDEDIRYPNNAFNSEFLDKGTLGAPRAVIATVGWKF